MSKEGGDVPTTPRTFSRGKKGKFCSEKKAAHLTSIARGKISHGADAMEESGLESEPEASSEELGSSSPCSEEDELSDLVFAEEEDVSDSEGKTSLFVICCFIFVTLFSNSQQTHDNVVVLKLPASLLSVTYQPMEACCIVE